MSLPVLRERVLASLIDSPQATARAEHALRELSTALAALAGMGHQFHIAPGPGPTLDEWPRQIFHLEQAPRGRLCRTVWDFWDLGPDWFFTLGEAQQASGMKAQNAGRGGVFTSGLPALTSSPPTDDFEIDDTAARLKAEFFATRGT